MYSIHRSNRIGFRRYSVPSLCQHGLVCFFNRVDILCKEGGLP
nr:MAG TPA: hypothetical protein [Caudoviricetes sp.]